MSFWEQIKEKTEAVPIKLKMLFLEKDLETHVLRLGTRVYDLGKTHGNLMEDKEMQSLFEIIGAKKKEMAALKEDFRKIWREEVGDLKRTLEKGGGAFEQIEINASSLAKGKQVKDLELPKDVLLGPILRGNNLIIPDGETEIREGDRITLMGTKNDVAATEKYLQEE